MNKTQEREIAAFVESLELHLARLIEEVVPFLAGLDERQAPKAIEMSIADLWNGRTFFDPVKMTLAQFFGSFVRENVKYVRCWTDPLEYTEEEHAVLRTVRGRREVVNPVPTPEPVKDPTYVAPKMEPPRKVGKECPPCWRCKWYYGWLPVKDYVPEKHSDPEIAEACERLDRRKIAIAHWVRSGKTWTEAELQLE
jgi:hypothetical protein